MNDLELLAGIGFIVLLILIAYTLFFWLLIFVLGLLCFRRWEEIDRLWERYWKDVCSAQ